MAYDGVPQPVGNSQLGFSGFLPTDDGTVVAGQPEVADTWYPVNDHPLDKAAYTFHIKVPDGLVAMSNGELKSRRSRNGSTTWVWDAKEPMASYLTTATIGEFNLRAYRKDGIRYWDAIDPDLFTPITPRTGDGYALSQKADSSYKRLSRTISVPAGGSQLSFWVTRATEPDWDFMFVEAHPVGSDDWTTLPDLNGHTSDNTGNSCPAGWQAIHPFLAHYQTVNDDGSCSPTGTTGVWQAASGASDGYEQWAVDLSDYAGQDVEVSISYASDETVQLNGVFLDDVVVSSGPGSTGFEDDGDTLDGWTVPGPPEGSPGNETDWIAGTAADAPTTPGAIADASLLREPEIIAFLSGVFGRYPFSAAGGIVDDIQGLGFALETQTRPVYAPDFFDSPENGDSVVVHELAHQWTGDSLALAAWQHIWLNEGFATYAEWLWSEREGLGTAQEIFDNFATFIPAGDPFWALTIGDPGPEQPVRHPGLLARRDDAARAAAPDRRRRLLPAPEAVGAPELGRQRHDAAVHRARRADLRAGSRRLLPDVAVHAREAAGDRARRCANARRGESRGQHAQRHPEGEEALSGAAALRRSASPAPRTPRPPGCVRGAG